ncbi:MAG: SLBB domain-containing protein [Candidatus Cloacimonadota bacterium]|nr:SLBB domain-containing protein [Candidatus Cloacimonadota bacterium]
MKKYILVILIIIFSISLFSQDSGRSYQSSNNSSAYFYSGSMSGSEQLKIYTYIWGQVRKPGMYIVPDNTDLLALISLAGGPNENAKLSKIRIVRPTADGEKIIWIDLKEYLETGSEKMIPTLKPGDTVIISGTFYYAFSKAVSFLSQIAVAVSVYTTIVSLNN